MIFVLCTYFSLEDGSGYATVESHGLLNWLFPSFAIAVLLEKQEINGPKRGACISYNRYFRFKHKEK